MNLDHLRHFPNQKNLLERDPFECVGLTIADILGNVYGQSFDPDFPYSLGFYLPSQTPADKGIDPYVAMQATVAYGILPSRFDTTSAATMGELYVANFNNYTPEQRAQALPFAQNGVKTLRSYQDIANYLFQYKQGALLALRWYEAFDSPIQDGTLLVPDYSDFFTSHAVAVYECTPKGLLIKSWQGEGYGLGGYSILPYNIFNMVFEEAYGFDPFAWRWLNLAYIGLRYPKRLNDILPQLGIMSA